MKKYSFLFVFSFGANFLFAQQWANNGNNIYNTNAGNVGIGVSNPLYPLEVNGGVYIYNGLISKVTQAGGMSGHFLGASNGNGNVVIQGGAGIGYNAWWLTGSSTSFKIGGHGGTEPTLGAINIDYDGRVGIGMNPGFQLDVSSTGRFGAPPNANANIIVQGGSGNYTAFWLTATNNVLKIGGVGGSEPSIGAINIDNLGNVGIGTTSTGSFRLAVEGKIAARELKVTLANPWPDYVFQKHYKLLPFSELERYIDQNKHLPNLPSAGEVETNGIELGNISTKLLEKIEELTLYVLQLKRENDLIKSEMVRWKKR